MYMFGRDNIALMAWDLQTHHSMNVTKIDQICVHQNFTAVYPAMTCQKLFINLSTILQTFRKQETYHWLKALFNSLYHYQNSHGQHTMNWTGPYIGTY